MPLIALDFAFRGGADQDPVDKPGVANMATELLDEGAGEYDSKSFHERVEAKAIELDFNASRDHTTGSLRTLSANQDEAFELLRLALTAAQFRYESTSSASASRCFRGCGGRPRAPTRWRASGGGRPRFPAIPMAGRCAAASNRFRPSTARSQGLHAAGVRPRHAQDRHRRRHRRRDRRQADRQGVRRPSGQEQSRRRRGGEAAGARAEDRDRPRCSAVRVDAGRDRHSRATTRISWPLSWSITCSAAVRSPRGSIARCARCAGSPIRCSVP